MAALLKGKIVYQKTRGMIGNFFIVISVFIYLKICDSDLNSILLLRKNYVLLYKTIFYIVYSTTNKTRCIQR